MSEIRIKATNIPLRRYEPDTGQRDSGAKAAAKDSEQRFGMEMYKDGLDVEVQRLVYHHGAKQVQRWTDEGMTVETMGKPRSMAAFRERQQERPSEVPKDVERRNAKSVQRSRGAHHQPSKAGSGKVPNSVRDVVSSSGQQLDDDIQNAMEERMGDSLGDVRIHTGPSAANACEDINARAFTVGNHIAFNRGEYDPSSAEGQHVLAHELAHVRQQTGGAVSMLPQEGELEIDPDERLEREAEETAEQVMRGGKIGVHRMGKSEVHVQRMLGSRDRGKTMDPTDVDVESTDGPDGPDEPEYREVNQDDDVSTQVAALAENQQTLRSQVDGLTQSAAEKMGVEAGKGTIAATGALVGTALMPGLGTLAGGAIGGLTGAVYERNFDAGAEAMSEMSGDLFGAIEGYIEDVVERYAGDDTEGYPGDN